MTSTSNAAQQPHDFEAVKSRLEVIADAVGDESLPLDEALDLFEEAVSLGLKVSDYVEKGIVVDDPETVTDAATASETATSGESSPNADGAAASDSPAPNESATE